LPHRVAQKGKARKKITDSFTLYFLVLAGVVDDTKLSMDRLGANADAEGTSNAVGSTDDTGDVGEEVRQLPPPDCHRRRHEIIKLPLLFSGSDSTGDVAAAAATLGLPAPGEDSSAELLLSRGEEISRARDFRRLTPPTPTLP
jgi:hypothetical protein